MSEVKQICHQILEKFDRVTGLHPEQGRMVDRPYLAKFLNFLLGIAREPPTDLDYGDLPNGNQWRLADLNPRNATHLVWQIISLCRVSCTTPFLRQLQTKIDELATDNLGSVGLVNCGKDLGGLFQGSHGMARFLGALLYEMLLDRASPNTWYGCGIPHRGQIAGYIFANAISDGKAEGQPPSTPLYLYEDQILETVSSRFIRQASHLGLFPKNTTVLVFHYSSRNLSVYLSGIQETMIRGERIHGRSRLELLRNRAVQATSSEGTLPVAPSFLPAALDSAGVQTLSHLVSHFGYQIYQVWEHIFRNGLQDGIQKRMNQPLAMAIVHNLHLCIPYVGQLLWWVEEGKQPELARDFKYREGVLRENAGEVAEYVLTDQREETLSENLPSHATHLAEMQNLLQRGNRSPVLDTPNAHLPNQIIPPSAQKNDPALAPKARLRIPLIPSSEDTLCKLGVIELFFSEPTAKLKPFADEITQFIAKAHLEGKKLWERLKELEARNKALQAEVRSVRKELQKEQELQKLQLGTHLEGLFGIQEKLVDIGKVLQPFFRFRNGFYEKLPSSRYQMRPFPHALLFEGEPGCGKSELCRRISTALGCEELPMLSKDLGPKERAGQWKKDLMEVAGLYKFAAKDHRRVVVIRADDLTWPAASQLGGEVRDEWNALIRTIGELLDDAKAINAWKPTSGPFLRNAGVGPQFLGKILWLFARNTDEDAGPMYEALRSRLRKVDMHFPKDMESRRQIIAYHTEQYGCKFDERALDQAISTTLEYGGRDLCEKFIQSLANEVWERYEEQAEKSEVISGAGENLVVTPEIIDTWLASEWHKGIMTEVQKKRQQHQGRIDQVVPVHSPKTLVLLQENIAAGAELYVRLQENRAERCTVPKLINAHGKTVVLTALLMFLSENDLSETGMNRACKEIFTAKNTWRAIQSQVKKLSGFTTIRQVRELLVTKYFPRVSER